MPRKRCCCHAEGSPCTCAMGNLYRFIEPSVLLLLKKKGCSYGYDLGAELQRSPITDAEIDPGALYRTLRTLEANGNVVSEWSAESNGPARRIYKLTPEGENHLREWAVVLGRVSESMRCFVEETEGELCVAPAAQRPPSSPGMPPHSWRNRKNSTSK